MPHADSSYFPASSSKEDIYCHLLQQATVLIEPQRNWVCNLANVASLLWHAYAALPRPSSAVNWAGFYIRADKFPSSAPIEAPRYSPLLLLGPFQGKPACQFIRFGKGVCGTAAEKKKTVIVPDVHRWEGHIACDAESRSEIVVPILANGETVAIIDIDCAEPSGFDSVDQLYLEQLAELLAHGCNW